MSNKQKWKELSCAQAERWVEDMGDTTLGLSPGQLREQPTETSSRRASKLLAGTFSCNLVLIIS